MKYSDIKGYKYLGDRHAWALVNKTVALLSTFL